MEEPSSLHIAIKIPNRAEDILDYVNQVIHALGDRIRLDDRVRRNVKLILVELVTNSIKHSNDDEASIRVSFNHPTLTIQKVDKGLQIQFASNSKQIPFVDINKTIQVSFSEKKKQHIKVLNQYEFEFVDAYKEGLELNSLPEHFGLYIITLASDRFIYRHDPLLMENRFIVNLDLKKKH
jgi:anti-sigma regulatory factor (Ser/Thr protein kinase)